MFQNVVTTLEDLRELYRPPSQGALLKQVDALDDNCRSFIAHSPLLFIGTSGPDGACDVSPKGGPPGFVAVLDSHRLAIPDLAGNNRLDSIENLVSGSQPAGIGLLFVIPGLEETLRVNGRGFVVVDDDVLDRCVVRDRRPRAAIGVEVTDAYIHCGKSFRRAGAWDSAAWPDRSDMPSVACMLRDHAGIEGVTAEAVQENLERGYAKTLW